MSGGEVAKSLPGHAEQEMKGWLYKWTNYLKGYQRRWFVLSNGILSYYRAEHGSGSNSGGKLSIRRRRKGPRQENRAEMSHTCRGTISLHGALIHAIDSCTFVISNGGTQSFHIKAANEVQRQSWVTALELAKAKAIRAMESEEEEETTAQAVPSEELNAVIKDLNERIDNIRSCVDLTWKEVLALQGILAELESGEDFASKSKLVNERAKLFQITSLTMIKECKEYLQTAQSQGHKWSKMLQHERDQRQRLEEMVEQLARQHSHLEQAAHRHIPNATTSTTSDDEDNEFYDAQDSSFILKIPLTARRDSNDATGSSSESEEPKSETKQVLVVAQSEDPKTMDVADRVNTTVGGVFGNHVSTPKAVRKRRTRVPEKPNYPLNLWSIMKNCIGKELSKIPMPVNFNEPLSMLQRLTEDYEYSELLDKAAQCKDACEQLAYVAAFTISSYSTTSNRTGKPFNPLLGETYECDRSDDLGWRCISEQVSHHPPMAAMHCEGRGWICWQEFTMTSKFRGRYLQVIPLGSANVEFTESGNKYTWRKVTTTVNNIIVGKLWVDHHGDMEIVGQKSAKGKICHLKYHPYSYFSRDAQRRVNGVVMNDDSKVKWVLRGEWDNQIEVAPVISTSGTANSPVYTTGNYKTIWTRRLPPPESDKYYNFTILASQLNEPEDDVAPTDSRLRPDQRLMEDGRWDESNKEKMRLEEKQRICRREREAEAERAASDGRPYPPYEPIWFSKEREQGTDNLIHVYRGHYWESKKKQDWSKCPDIF